MSDIFIGQIIMTGFNFAPRNLAQCDGQLIPISQNSALFSLLGTMYGGDGRVTFGLPNLRGRTPLGGNISGGYPLGMQGGVEYATVSASEIPAHQHQIVASSLQGAGRNPRNGLLAASSSSAMYAAPSGNVTLHPATLATAGGSVAHENRQPYLALNFCIVLTGIYPTRN